MTILESLYNGKNIKELNISQLNELCADIRKEIKTVVGNNGGHLSSNLGSVELTVALHYVFDVDVDKFIFDVGHQSYAHKILSGRFNEFHTIRTSGGLSGFPDPNESKADAFISGHAGTSISAGLGYCRSRDYLGQDYFVVCVVGDASFFNGENLEAITSSNDKPRNFILLLNDNGMSISKNDNGLYKLISKITIKKGYNKFNTFLAKCFGNSWFGNWLRKVKKSIKNSLSTNTVSDSIGLKYVGKFDGHNLKTLISVLEDVKQLKQATLLHLNTVKGKGDIDAEKDSTRFHGVSKNLQSSSNYFSNGISSILSELKQKTPELHAITAGMRDGTGLKEFAKTYPDAFIDVGIQEEYAVTLAGGMAISGTKPIVFLYSTFMQRAYDQIVHDICMQNLPVVFCVDRAGVVGNDGKTHQGVFDISYLSHLPNATIFAPKNLEELKQSIELGFELSSPVFIRYPNGAVSNFGGVCDCCDVRKWETVSNGNDKNVILAVGPRMIEVSLKAKEISGKDIKIINARCIKPLDFDLLDSLVDYNVITLEENVKQGGFGSAVLNYYNEEQKFVKVNIFAIKDAFVPHASIAEQLEVNFLTAEDVVKKLL